MVTVALSIDGTAVTAAAESTLLAAADTAGIYIPRLCAHPDLPAVRSEDLAAWDKVYQGAHPVAAGRNDTPAGCGLCEVEIAGRDEPVRACASLVADGMEVVTVSAGLTARRRQALRDIFATHPHACVQCAQRSGCSREPCSTDVAKEERCCDIFHDCELRRVAEFVGIPADTPRYRPAGRPLVADDPLIRWDHELCIGCLRCVRVCRDLRQIDALGFVRDTDGRTRVGSRAATLAASGCHYCLSCVEVCPTGSLQLAYDEARQDGERLPRCVVACPAGIDIPRYLREVRRGEFARAEAVVREAAPLPRVLGQVCFHPCEEACLRGELRDELGGETVGEPLAVCALKRAAVEHADEPLWRAGLPPVPESGKSVAIVGAGPAGLSAAWFLRLRGHAVDVYDAQPAAGGWLRDGVPAYRLSSEALTADVQDIADLGVGFHFGVDVGQDVTLTALRERYDAVFLAVGARDAKALACPGADLPGVASGLALLQELAADDGPPAARFAGETVVVIGGGNVAIDVARTALRLGPDAVHLYCLERRDEMPAHAWEVAEAEAEGVVVHGGWGPARIVGGERVEAVEFTECLAVFDKQGVFAPRFAAEPEVNQPADRVLVAIGQRPALGLLDGAGAAAQTADGGLAADRATLRVGADLFAGGEVVTGPASVVTAVAQGRRAAAGIDRQLGGDGRVAARLLSATEPEVRLEPDPEFLARPRIPQAAAAGDAFAMAAAGYDADEARQEADRCLRCDLRLQLRPNPAPPEPWLAFASESLAAVPAAAGVYQLLDEAKTVYAIKGVADLREALTALVGSASRAHFFLYEEDPLFSKRESELNQVYLQQHGNLPPGEGDDDLDDLY